MTLHWPAAEKAEQWSNADRSFTWRCLCRCSKVKGSCLAWCQISNALICPAISSSCFLSEARNADLEGAEAIPEAGERLTEPQSLQSRLALTKNGTSIACKDNEGCLWSASCWCLPFKQLPHIGQQGCQQHAKAKSSIKKHAAHPIAF